MNMHQPRIMTLPVELRERAWKVLVKELGIVDATRFVMAVEPGSEDSVQKYTNLWEGMSLEEVHEEILEAKKRGEI